MCSRVFVWLSRILSSNNLFAPPVDDPLHAGADAADAVDEEGGHPEAYHRFYDFKVSES